MHGGAFRSGDKTIASAFYTQMAQLGYAVFSVSYRLTADYYGTKEGYRPVLDAQEDFRAAIRFVKMHAGDYRLDTDMIIAAGESAGAITALNMSYAKEAQYDGDSGNPGLSSNPDGVLAISGGLKGFACDYVDDVCTNYAEAFDKINDIGTFENQPPLVMIHGTEDFIVPYEFAKMGYDRAQSVGLPSTLITMDGLGHVPYEALLTTYFPDMMTGLYQLVTKGAQAPEGCHEVDEEDKKDSEDSSMPWSDWVWDYMDTDEASTLFASSALALSTLVLAY